MEKVTQPCFPSDDKDDEIIPSQAYKSMIADILSKEPANSSNHSAGGKGNAASETTKRKTFVADNGTRYVWDDEEDCWVEDSEFNGQVDAEENAPDSENENDSDEEGEQPHAAQQTADSAPSQKRKRNKKKKPKKAVNNWVYVSGLPHNITPEEVKAHFSKVGLIAINPSDQSDKIKLYRDENGQLKGDGAICYNSELSVEMAVDVLNGGYIRPNNMVTVTRATFEAGGSGGAGGQSDGTNAPKKRTKMSHAQVKVAISAMRQALSWAEDDDSGIAPSSALKIVVIMHMFTPQDFVDDPTFEDELEKDISSECYKCGEIEKITLFPSSPLGVVIVKFSTSFAAQECIKLMNGRWYGGRQLKCLFWDGVTDYGAANTAEALDRKEKEEQQRLEEFGNWIESEELPEEFELRVEK